MFIRKKTAYELTTSDGSREGGSSDLREISGQTCVDIPLRIGKLIEITGTKSADKRELIARGE